MTSIKELEKQMTQLTEVVSKLSEVLVSKPSSSKKSTTTKVKEVSTIEIPAREYSEIPSILSSMNKDTLISMFGFVGENKEKPYNCVGVTKFFREYNITPKQYTYKGKTKTLNPSLSLAHKHIIIEGIIKELSKTKAQKIKDNCINYLTSMVKNPPQESRYGKPLTEKNKQHLIQSYQQELDRWIKK